MLMRVPRIRMGLAVFALAPLLSATGCKASGTPKHPQPTPTPARHVVVVAPVLNLSGTTDFDTVKFTDAVASELVGFAGVAAIPVNSSLAALARRGKTRVESPADAIELAREFGAQATLVTAVTEYRPYDPPVIGMIMQWYMAPGASAGGRPEMARTAESDNGRVAELSGVVEVGPQVQVQRVFNAADKDVLDEIEDYAGQRNGQVGPYGWRRFVKSQELYVRYCCWSLIRSILAQGECEYVTLDAIEAQP